MKLWKEEQDIKKLTRYQTRKGGTDCSKMLFLINLFLVITNNSLLVTGSFFSFLSLLVKKIMTSVTVKSKSFLVTVIILFFSKFACDEHI